MSSTTCDPPLTYEHPGIAERWPALTGRQAPHWEWFVAGNTEDGRKAVELSVRMKAPVFPWQSDSLYKILTRADDGGWAHTSVLLVCPRQNGKSLILSMRIIYGLMRLGETIVYTAHRWVTAEDIFKRTRELIESVPSLRARIKGVPTCSQGRGIINTTNGGRVVFTTRSPDAGRGLTKIDLVIYDEGYDLTDGDQAALNPAQLAADDPQTIYASTAVNASEQANGFVFGAARQRGLAHDDGMYAAEWCAPEGMPREDENTWRYANPSYGVIQTAKKLRDLVKKQNGTAKGRKFLDVDILGRGDWPVEATVEVWSVVTEDRWRAGEVSAPAERVGPVGVGIDRTLSGDYWAISAVWRTATGELHGEVGYFTGGTSAQIAATMFRVYADLDPCAVVTDSRSPALVIDPDLGDYEVETMTTPQLVTATRGYFDDVIGTDDRPPMLTHTPQPATDDALEGATRRTLPGGDWVVDKQGDTVIVPISSMIYARYALLTYGHRQDVKTAALPVVAGSGYAVDDDLSGYDAFTDDFDAFASTF